MDLLVVGRFSGCSFVLVLLVRVRPARASRFSCLPVVYRSSSL
ncbi:hypothetical protein HMPREF0294_1579 [Corynebacterium glucuronolyticum ATCC 51867]|uniref:Uncharacterized protein n=1 Tax=Corynebacterium glucuronolyticum ATCC 51866 TaxID=548478 RepID=A0ABP2DWJ6_9CORY|nr:hypothetical protein HMPREF0294_1579 [Corynebacterium glucuronolyticum ATCC 51867]EEI62235.1 hypothetical protein HMPREF0293_2360 [Corynebacterium glucuronolyticum ATCC 51866]